MTLTEYTCKTFGCTLDEMYSRTHRRAAVEARQVCMSVMRDFTILPLRKIGEYFNLDHSTVLHSIEKVRNLYSIEREFRSMVDKVYDACRSGEVDVPYSNLIKPPVYVPCDYLDEDMKLYAELV